MTESWYVSPSPTKAVAQSMKHRPNLRDLPEINMHVLLIGIDMEISTATLPLGSSGAEFEEKYIISYSYDCPCQNDHLIIFLIWEVRKKIFASLCNCSKAFFDFDGEKYISFSVRQSKPLETTKEEESETVAGKTTMRKSLSSTFTPTDKNVSSPTGRLNMYFSFLRTFAMVVF